MEDEDGKTPLHEATATSSWDVELVGVLLEHNAGVNARIKDGSAPLLIVAELECGSVGVVQMLIKRGANVCAEDEGENPVT